MDDSGKRQIGIFLMLGSAFLFSTAGIFTKGVTASAWQVIFWRALFSAILVVGTISARRRWRTEVTGMGWRGILAAIIGAGGTAAFLSAFKLTSVANVALIYSMTPLLAALLAWALIREAPGWSVVLGALLGVCGIGVILSGSLGQVHLKGDLLALVMSVALALLFVLYRCWPDTPSAGPTALSSVLLLPVAAVMAPPLAVPLAEIAVMAAFGLVFALASVLMFEGAKCLPSGQTGLLSTAETPFAMVLAWLILAEWPGAATLAGGVLVLAGVMTGSRRPRRNTSSRPLTENSSG
ncbi:EamA-like transporter family protein [Roseovarius litorisediminis]|uniref:EamA-like transporter family protein n=1 Tax=Roseovarius litorisediminis TaxID=1312363 RepID=A0A1Y5RXL0_9RHOB|nr:DMT family transporter [Roseovarius litorisediminis]SLN27675.1 EamA-like transporter family protein [Roseovarius litorisediminis]